MLTQKTKAVKSARLRRDGRKNLTGLMHNCGACPTGCVPSCPLWDPRGSRLDEIDDEIRKLRALRATIAAMTDKQYDEAWEVTRDPGWKA
jgi:hypothetical protein